MRLLRLHLLLMLLLLWTPVLLLIAFSFNARLSLQHWTFSADAYATLWDSLAVRQAALDSAIVALASAAIATLLGTLAALSLSDRGARAQTGVLALLLLPALAPEVLVAAGLLGAYAFVDLAPGLGSIVSGHALLSFGFAALLVLRRLGPGDRAMREASATLGASRFTGFRRVTLPLILPGMLAALLLSLTLSLGEFVLASLVAAAEPSAVTLPVLARELLRSLPHPQGLALAAALLLLSFLLILLALRLSRPPRSA